MYKNTSNLGMLCFKGMPENLVIIYSALRRISGASKKEWLMRLKMLVLIMTAFLVQVSAAGFAQKVSLKERNRPLKQVLQMLTEQTGYDFICDVKLLEGKTVTIELENTSLEEALEVVFKSQNLVYVLENKFVTVKPKSPSFLETFIARLTAIDVRGIILDQEGLPLEGAILTVKGTNRSVRSNSRGEFVLHNVDDQAMLLVSYIGYEGREIKVAKDLGIIKMVLLEGKLNEVEVTVNTGYQTLSRERTSGSFERLNNKSLNERVGTTILARLEGVSSLAFDKVDTRPAITIRGKSSIQINSDPLVIVDNFPYEGDLKNINPNDVESVTILKDAAATSIWGTRAGNGVIVITTKRGSYGQPLHFDFNSNVSFAVKPNLDYVKRISSSDVIDLEKSLFSQGFYHNDENSTQRLALSKVVELLIAKRDRKIDPDKAEIEIDKLRLIDSRDDYSKYLYRTGVNQQYALSASGGAEKITYFFSGGFDKNKSVERSSYDRVNLKATTTIMPVKNLSITAGLVYTQSESVSGIVAFGVDSKIMPYDRIADDYGNAMPIDRFRKTYIDTAGNGKLLDWKYYPLTNYKHSDRRVNLQSVVANLSSRYQILNALSIDFNYQYEKQNSNVRSLNGVESFSTRSLINSFTQITPTGVKNVVPIGGILGLANKAINSHNFRAQVNLNQSWGKFNLSGIAGAELRNLNSSSNENLMYGYDADILTVADMDYINPYITYIGKYKSFIPSGISVGETTNHFLSQYLNLAYSYDSRYTLTGSVRRDASNLFGVKTNDKWQPLWSAGVVWNISNEKFYTLKEIPTLRFRMTYGVSGNVDQSKSAVTTLRYTLPADHTNFNRVFINQYANPLLRWEKTAMFNAGFDFSLKNEVLNGSIEYYIKRGTDLFGQSPIDQTTGVGSTVLTTNAANMSGRGVELSLNAKILDGKIKWLSGLIFSTNHNEITKYFQPYLNAGNFVADGQIISPLKGYPVYSILSYQWAGLDAKGDPQGMLNGKKSTDYLSISSAPFETLHYSGSAVPTVFGSFNNSITVDRFKLSVSISYKFNYFFRRSTINYTELLSMNAFGQGTNDYAKRWMQSGDENKTDVPAFNYPYDSRKTSFYSTSSVLVEKGDHIRLQYVNLSYDFNSAKQSKVGNGIQVFMNAANLGIIWRKTKYNLDPDYSNRSVPEGRVISIGIRAGI